MPFSTSRLFYFSQHKINGKVQTDEVEREDIDKTQLSSSQRGPGKVPESTTIPCNTGNPRLSRGLDWILPEVPSHPLNLSVTGLVLFFFLFVCFDGGKMKILADKLCLLIEL